MTDLEQLLERAAAFCEQTDDWPPRTVWWKREGKHEGWVSLDCVVDDAHYLHPDQARFILEGWLREWLQVKCDVVRIFDTGIAPHVNIGLKKDYQEESVLSALLSAAEAVLEKGDE